MQQIFINDKVISERAYAYSQNLQKVTIGSNVEEICDSAFAGCISLHTVVITPNTKKIHKNAFGQNYNVDLGYSFTDDNYDYGDFSPIEKVIVIDGKPNEVLMQSLSHLPNVQIVSEYSNENRPILENTNEFQLQ